MTNRLTDGLIAGQAPGHGRSRITGLLAILTLVALGTVGGHGSAAAAAPRNVRAAAIGVDVSSLTFTDPSRATPARIGVPAHAGRTVHVVVYDPVGETSARPTVVFAPGWNNESATYDPLLRAVASAGYLVIGVDSPGVSSYFSGAVVSGTRDIANNARDLSAALTNLETGPWGARVDTAAVAAMGHSDGGSASPPSPSTRPTRITGSTPTWSSAEVSRTAT